MKTRLERCCRQLFNRERCQAMKAAVRSQKGFNLIEITVVIVIMGLLMSIVGVAVNDALVSAKQDTTRVQIKSIENALEVYYLDNGRYPTSSQKLDALMKAPTDSKKAGKQYLKGDKVPLDGWENEFHYLSPGPSTPYLITSYGADGQQGGDGFDADITSNDTSK